MKRLTWLLWVVVTLVLAGYYGNTLFLSEDKSELLIGDASHGHYQIEMACTSCHTEAFGGTEILQNACTGCHQEDLDNAHDSHPKKKFTDPREAYRLEILDARYCISCHTEHQDEQTRAMGVTLPDDFCWHCHKDVADTRKSHEDLAFDSCASAGCHNYHDNRALFENFLVANANQPWLNVIAQIPNATHASLTAKRDVITKVKTPEARQVIEDNPEILAHWPDTVHGAANIDCGGCHIGSNTEAETWIAKPNLAQCQTCHQQEAKGFTEGKHGMRLAGAIATVDAAKPELEPMSPALNRGALKFHKNSEHAQQGCNSCHKAHDYDRNFAKVEACLSCHTDDHSVNFKESPHGKLWLAGIENIAVEADAQQKEVTCATCHLPKITSKHGGLETTRVDHNQNNNLRPNEKMIRPVCMNCHSLEFSIDALADPNLIENNFNEKPGIHIESMDWALERARK
ncbi:MAG: cytochrome c3 family protein [Cellvibrionaceae bacterium]